MKVALVSQEPFQYQFQYLGESKVLALHSISNLISSLIPCHLTLLSLEIEIYNRTATCTTSLVVKEPH